MEAIFNKQFLEDLSRIDNSISITKFMLGNIVNRDDAFLPKDGNKFIVDSIWEDKEKTLQVFINFSNREVFNKKYNVVYIYYSLYEKIDNIAFVLINEDLSNIEFCQTRNLFTIEFPLNTYSNVYTETSSDLIAFLESPGNEVGGNLIREDVTETKVVSRDSYFRLLRSELSSQLYKNTTWLDEKGRLQYENVEFKVYHEDTLVMSVFDYTDFVQLNDGIRTKFNLLMEGGFVKVVGTVKYSKYRLAKGKVEYLGDGNDEITGIDGAEIINDSVINGFNYKIDNVIYNINYFEPTVGEYSSYNPPTGIFHIELPYYNYFSKKIEVLKSNPVRLIQDGNFGIFKVINRTTPYFKSIEDKGAIYVFNWRKEETKHSFTVEVRSGLFSEKSINIEFENEEALARFGVTPEIKINALETDPLVSLITVNLVAKEDNDDELLWQPTIENEDSELESVLLYTKFHVTLGNDVYTETFYMVQHVKGVGISMYEKDRERSSEEIEVYSEIEDDTLVFDSINEIEIRKKVGIVNDALEDETYYWKLISKDKDVYIKDIETNNELKVGDVIPCGDPNYIRSGTKYFVDNEYLNDDFEDKLQEDLVFVKITEKDLDKEFEDTWYNALQYFYLRVHIKRTGQPPRLDIIDPDDENDYILDNVFNTGSIYPSKIDCYYLNIKSNCMFTAELIPELGSEDNITFWENNSDILTISESDLELAKKGEYKLYIRINNWGRSLKNRLSYKIIFNYKGDPIRPTPKNGQYLFNSEIKYYQGLIYFNKSIQDDPELKLLRVEYVDNGVKAGTILDNIEGLTAIDYFLPNSMVNGIAGSVIFTSNTDPIFKSNYNDIECKINAVSIEAIYDEDEPKYLHHSLNLSNTEEFTNEWNLPDYPALIDNDADILCYFNGELTDKKIELGLYTQHKPVNIISYINSKLQNTNKDDNFLKDVYYNPNDTTIYLPATISSDSVNRLIRYIGSYYNEPLTLDIIPRVCRSKNTYDRLLITNNDISKGLLDDKFERLDQALIRIKLLRNNSEDKFVKLSNVYNNDVYLNITRPDIVDVVNNLNIISDGRTLVYKVNDIDEVATNKISKEELFYNKFSTDEYYQIGLKDEFDYDLFIVNSYKNDLYNVVAREKGKTYEVTGKLLDKSVDIPFTVYPLYGYTNTDYQVWRESSNDEYCRDVVDADVFLNGVKDNRDSFQSYQLSGVDNLGDYILDDNYKVSGVYALGDENLSDEYFYKSFEDANIKFNYIWNKEVANASEVNISGISYKTKAFEYNGKYYVAPASKDKPELKNCLELNLSKHAIIQLPSTSTTAYGLTSTGKNELSFYSITSQGGGSRVEYTYEEFNRSQLSNWQLMYLTDDDLYNSSIGEYIMVPKFDPTYNINSAPPIDIYTGGRIETVNGIRALVLDNTQRRFNFITELGSFAPVSRGYISQEYQYTPKSATLILSNVGGYAGAVKCGNGTYAGTGFRQYVTNTLPIYLATRHVVNVDKVDITTPISCSTYDISKYTKTDKLVVTLTSPYPGSPVYQPIYSLPEDYSLDKLYLVDGKIIDDNLIECSNTNWSTVNSTTLELALDQNKHETIGGLNYDSFESYPVNNYTRAKVNKYNLRKRVPTGEYVLNYKGNYYIISDVENSISSNDLVDRKLNFTERKNGVDVNQINGYYWTTSDESKTSVIVNINDESTGVEGSVEVDCDAYSLYTISDKPLIKLDSSSIGYYEVNPNFDIYQGGKKDNIDRLGEEAVIDSNSILRVEEQGKFTYYINNPQLAKIYKTYSYHENVGIDSKYNNICLVEYGGSKTYYMYSSSDVSTSGGTSYIDKRKAVKIEVGKYDYFTNAVLGKSSSSSVYCLSNESTKNKVNLRSYTTTTSTSSYVDQYEESGSTVFVAEQESQAVSDKDFLLFVFPNTTDADDVYVGYSVIDQSAEPYIKDGKLVGVGVVGGSIPFYKFNGVYPIHFIKQSNGYFEFDGGQANSNNISSAVFEAAKHYRFRSAETIQHTVALSNGTSWSTATGNTFSNVKVDIHDNIVGPTTNTTYTDEVSSKTFDLVKYSLTPLLAINYKNVWYLHTGNKDSLSINEDDSLNYTGYVSSEEKTSTYYNTSNVSLKIADGGGIVLTSANHSEDLDDPIDTVELDKYEPAEGTSYVAKYLTLTDEYIYQYEGNYYISSSTGITIPSNEIGPFYSSTIVDGVSYTNYNERIWKGSDGPAGVVTVKEDCERSWVPTYGYYVYDEELEGLRILYSTEIVSYADLFNDGRVLYVNEESISEREEDILPTEDKYRLQALPDLNEDCPGVLGNWYEYKSGDVVSPGNVNTIFGYKGYIPANFYKIINELVTSSEKSETFIKHVFNLSNNELLTRVPDKTVNYYKFDKYYYVFENEEDLIATNIYQEVGSYSGIRGIIKNMAFLEDIGNSGFMLGQYPNITVTGDKKSYVYVDRVTETSKEVYCIETVPNANFSGSVDLYINDGHKSLVQSRKVLISPAKTEGTGQTPQVLYKYVYDSIIEREPQVFRSTKKYKSTYDSNDIKKFTESSNLDRSHLDLKVALRSGVVSKVTLVDYTDTVPYYGTLNEEYGYISMPNDQRLTSAVMNNVSDSKLMTRLYYNYNNDFKFFLDRRFEDFCKVLNLKKSMTTDLKHRITATVTTMDSLSKESEPAIITQLGVKNGIVLKDNIYFKGTSKNCYNIDLDSSDAIDINLYIGELDLVKLFDNSDSLSNNISYTLFNKCNITLKEYSLNASSSDCRITISDSNINWSMSNSNVIIKIAENFNTFEDGDKWFTLNIESPTGNSVEIKITQPKKGYNMFVHYDNDNDKSSLVSNLYFRSDGTLLDKLYIEKMNSDGSYELLYKNTRPDSLFIHTNLALSNDNLTINSGILNTYYSDVKKISDVSYHGDDYKVYEITGFKRDFKTNSLINEGTVDNPAENIVFSCKDDNDVSHSITIKGHQGYCEVYLYTDRIQENGSWSKTVDQVNNEFRVNSLNTPKDIVLDDKDYIKVVSAVSSGNISNPGRYSYFIPSVERREFDWSSDNECFIYGSIIDYTDRYGTDDDSIWCIDEENLGNMSSGGLIIVSADGNKNSDLSPITYFNKDKFKLSISENSSNTVVYRGKSRAIICNYETTEMSYPINIDFKIKIPIKVKYRFDYVEGGNKDSMNCSYIFYAHFRKPSRPVLSFEGQSQVYVSNSTIQLSIDVLNLPKSNYKLYNLSDLKIKLIESTTNYISYVNISKFDEVNKCFNIIIEFNEAFVSDSECIVTLLSSREDDFYNTDMFYDNDETRKLELKFVKASTTAPVRSALASRLLSDSALDKEE